MSSNKPTRARKRRHSKACTRCRGKKIRCDFQYPTCGACLRAGETCLGYDSIHGVEKPRSTVTYLEQEAARLEAELQRIKAQSSSITGIIHTEVEGLTTHLAAAVLAPEGTFGTQDRPLPLTSTYFLSSSPVPYFNTQTWDNTNARQPRDGSPTTVDICSLPRHVVDTMLKHYCEIYRPQYPAMEESALYKACDKVYNNDQPSDFDAFCVCITLAISTNTLRHRDKKRAEAATSGFWAKALLHLEQVGRSSSWDRLQALQLLIHYGCLNPTDVDVVRCAAAATRLCLQLGLHQEIPASLQAGLDVSSLNDRKRLFWHSYSMDSAIHSTQCWPFEWPASSHMLELSQPGSNVSPTAHVWSLRQIESAITLAFYYPSWISENSLPDTPFGALFTRLETRLNEWHKTAQETLHLREKLEFHELHYQMQALRLNRPSPRCRDPTGIMRKKALHACIGVIRELSVADRLGKLFYLWHAAHCIVEAAICLLASVLNGMQLSADRTHLVREDSNIYTRYLQAAPILLWKIAHRWKNIAHHASALDAISSQVLETLQRWSDGDIVEYSDSHNLRQKLNQMSRFSPFPSEATTTDNDEHNMTAGTDVSLVPKASGDTSMNTNWDFLQPAANQGTFPFANPSGALNGDALAWDFSGMDPEQIFVSLLEQGQVPPTVDDFVNPIQYTASDSNPHRFEN
ncbi:hypothetical protein BX600DRAFT_444914 [Xylariales sp. PMI_506]|nr:hypothetical protein BX600DRAFT_444914 [Xylariales sp. PMI_506]